MREMGGRFGSGHGELGKGSAGCVRLSLPSHLCIYLYIC